MRIEKNKMVTIDYTLSAENGEMLESSRGKEPLTYIHGSGGLIRGFETALEGRAPHDAFTFTVNPEEGYGERREELVFRAKREQFAEIPDLAIGMPLRVQTPEGAMVVRVAEVSDDAVSLDANHPLSGKRLTFDVKVLDVRDATAEELEDDQRQDGCGCGASSCSDSCGEGCCA